MQRLIQRAKDMEGSKQRAFAQLLHLRLRRVERDVFGFEALAPLDGSKS